MDSIIINCCVSGGKFHVKNPVKIRHHKKVWDVESVRLEVIYIWISFDNTLIGWRFPLPFDWLLFLTLITPKFRQDCSWRKNKHHRLDYAICFDKRNRQITHDLSKPECVVGFLDILLSFLFSFNENTARALFISTGTNINKQIDLYWRPMENRS